MPSPRRTLRALKNVASCAWRVKRRRRRGQRVSPRWSFLYAVGVEYLRVGFAHLETLSHADYRREMEALAVPDPVERGLEISEATIGGRPVEVIRPRGVEPQRTILYLHGGSYHYGSALTHRPITLRLAIAARAEVLVVDYRLAPEHPYPAGLEDAIAVYRELIAGRADPRSLVIAGDSAGGGLTGALILALRERGIAKPAGAAMICPWVDISVRDGSMVRNAEVDWLDHRTIGALAEGYAGGRSFAEPGLSPIRGVTQGDPGALPPILVQVGSLELLVDQAVDFAEQAKAAGVDVALRVWEDMVHDWHLFASFDRQGMAAIEEIAAFAVRVTD